jgi:hypothetical protein
MNRRVLILIGLAGLGVGLASVAAERQDGASYRLESSQEAREALQQQRDEAVETRALRRTAERAITAGDCGYLRDPESFLGAAGRRQRDISRVTDEVALMVKGDDLRQAVEEVPYRNFIDVHIFEKMRRDRVPHPGLANDETFLRRVTLDLTGRTPSPNEVRSFVADTASDKRERAIEALIGSPEWVDKWTMFYGDLFKNVYTSSTSNRSREARNAFYRWLRAALNDGWPYNEIATAMLTAGGLSSDDGPANWIVNGITPMGPIQDQYDTLAAQTAKQFLGIEELDCLLCHDGAGHLNQLNLWGSRATRMQAWQMSAFFSRTTFVRQPALSTGGQPYLVSDNTTGRYDLNTTAGNRTPRQRTEGVTSVTPRYLFSGAAGAGNYRASLAQILTADRQFARAAVNYIWTELMGMGIVDPPDQFDLMRQDPNNPPPSPWTVQPSHPELLEQLTTEFINSGYNLRYLMQLIANSSAYQLSSRFPGQWKPDYARYFARHFARRLKSEEVHDAILRATGTTVSLAVPTFTTPITWAMQLPDPLEGVGSGPFLNIFLRGNRDTFERSDEVTVQQALALMNDNFVISRVRQTAATSMVNGLISGGRTDTQIVEELYLRALGRFPTPDERAAAINSYRGKSRVAGAEDVLWVLLNKVDFLFNY